MRLYVVVMPENVNSHLACYGGKILAHLPNYLECSEELPVVTDSTKQIFAIFVDKNDVHKVMDGGRQITYLWKGDKASRHQAHELVTVEIQPVSMSASAAGKPTDIAKAALAEYPEPIRLAGVVTSISPALLSALPPQTAQLKAWADQVLDQYLATSKG